MNDKKYNVISEISEEIEKNYINKSIVQSLNDDIGELKIIIIGIIIAIVVAIIGIPKIDTTSTIQFPSLLIVFLELLVSLAIVCMIVMIRLNIKDHNMKKTAYNDLFALDLTSFYEKHMNNLMGKDGQLDLKINDFNNKKKEISYFVNDKVPISINVPEKNLTYYIEDEHHNLQDINIRLNNICYNTDIEKPTIYAKYSELNNKVYFDLLMPI